MNFLILGGAGFIGQHLTATLLTDSNDTVTVIDSLRTSRINQATLAQYGSRYKFIQADITTMDRTHLLDVCQSADVIYHLAGSVGVEYIDKDPRGTLFNNLNLNNVLIPIFQQANKHVVFSSTSEIYGEGPFVETSSASIGPSTKLRWGYAASKLMMEFMLNASNIPVTIVRFFNVVGPGQVGDYGMVLPRFVKAALMNEDLVVYGTGKQIRSFCHINDAIDALVRVTPYVGELFNIGNAEPVTIYELAERVIELTGSSSSIITVPYEQAFSAHHGDINNRVPDLTKIRLMTGYQPEYNLDDIIYSVI